MSVSTNSDKKNEVESIIDITDYKDSENKSNVCRSSEKARIKVKKTRSDIKRMKPLSEKVKVVKSSRNRLKPSTSVTELRIDYQKEQVIADLLNVDVNDPQFKSFLKQLKTFDRARRNDSNGSSDSSFSFERFSSILNLSLDIDDGKCDKIDQMQIKDTCFIKSVNPMDIIYDYIIKRDDIDSSLPSEQKTLSRDSLKLKVKTVDEEIRYHISIMKSRKWKGVKNNIKRINDFFIQSRLKREEMNSKIRRNFSDRLCTFYWDMKELDEIIPETTKAERRKVTKFYEKYTPFRKTGLYHAINFFFGGTILNIFPWIMNWERAIIWKNKKLLKQSNELNYLNETKSEAKLTISNPIKYPLFDNCTCKHCQFCSEIRKTVIIPKIPVNAKDYRVQRRPFTVLQHFFKDSNNFPSCSDI